MITDRYHFNPVISAARHPRLGLPPAGVCVFSARRGGFAVKMIAVTGDDEARGDPAAGAARRGSGCRWPGGRISLAGASRQPW